MDKERVVTKFPHGQGWTCIANQPQQMIVKKNKTLVGTLGTFTCNPLQEKCQLKMWQQSSTQLQSVALKQQLNVMDIF